MKILILLLATLLNANNYYPECGIVTDVTQTGVEAWETTVTFQTMNGNLFAFDGGEDLEKGDVIAVIMNSNGTPNVIDDMVIDVRYCSPVNVNIIE